MHGAADESQGDQNSVELVVSDLGSLLQTVPVADDFDACFVWIEGSRANIRQSAVPSRNAAVTSMVAMLL